MATNEDIVASVVLFLLSVVGLVVNGVAIVFVRRTKALRNVFGNLCLSHAIADIGILAIFLFYVVPISVLPEEVDTSSVALVIGARVGQLSILLWNVCVYSHLFIAANRFLVICFPLRSQKYSNRVFMFIVEACVWTFGTFHSIPYSWADCAFTYDPTTQLWNFASGSCGAILMEVDFVEGLTCVSAIVMLDLATFFKIRCANRQFAQTNETTRSRRNRQEIMFFIQGCCQGSLFIAKLLSFYFVSTWSTNRWYVFITTSIAWQMSHVLDGVVLLVFNPEFRNRLAKKVPVITVTASNTQQRTVSSIAPTTL